EVLASTVVVAAVGVIALLGVALVRRLPIRPAATALVAGGGPALTVGLALGAPGLLTMFFGPQVVHGTIQPPDTYVTDLASLVVPDRLMLIAPDPVAALTASFTGLEVEWDGYVGLPLLALLAATAWRWRARPAVLWASIAAAAVVVLSLGPH